MELAHGLVVGSDREFVPLAVDAKGRQLMLAVELASNGTPLPVDSLSETYSYNVDGLLHYTEVSYQGVTYRTTYSYDVNGRLTGIAKLVAQ